MAGQHLMPQQDAAGQQIPVSQRVDNTVTYLLDRATTDWSGQNLRLLVECLLYRNARTPLAPLETLDDEAQRRVGEILVTLVLAPSTIPELTPQALTGADLDDPNLPVYERQLAEGQLRQTVEARMKAIERALKASHTDSLSALVQAVREGVQPVLDASPGLSFERGNRIARAVTSSILVSVLTPIEGEVVEAALDRVSTLFADSDTPISLELPTPILRGTIRLPRPASQSADTVPDFVFWSYGRPMQIAAHTSTADIRGMLTKEDVGFGDVRATHEYAIRQVTTYQSGWEEQKMKIRIVKIMKPDGTIIVRLEPVFDPVLEPLMATLADRAQQHWHRDAQHQEPPPTEANLRTWLAQGAYSSIVAAIARIEASGSPDAFPRTKHYLGRMQDRSSAPTTEHRSVAGGRLVPEDGSDSSRGGAVTVTGAALTSQQHRDINAAIHADFAANSARRVNDEALPEAVRGANVTVFVVPGLAQFDELLIAHPGRGGEAFEHKKRHVYLSPARFAFVQALSDEARTQFWRHEIVHLNYPENDEATVQREAAVELVIAAAGSSSLASAQPASAVARDGEGDTDGHRTRVALTAEQREQILSAIAVDRTAHVTKAVWAGNVTAYSEVRGMLVPVRGQPRCDPVSVPGLAPFDDLLAADSASAGAVFDPAERRVYFSPSRLAYLQSLPMRDQEAFWRYALDRLDHPALAEDVVRSRHSVPDSVHLDTAAVLAQTAGRLQVAVDAIREPGRSEYAYYRTEIDLTVPVLGAYGATAAEHTPLLLHAAHAVSRAVQAPWNLGLKAIESIGAAAIPALIEIAAAPGPFTPTHQMALGLLENLRPRDSQRMTVQITNALYEAEQPDRVYQLAGILDMANQIVLLHDAQVPYREEVLDGILRHRGRHSKQFTSDGVHQALVTALRWLASQPVDEIPPALWEACSSAMARLGITHPRIEQFKGLEAQAFAEIEEATAGLPEQTWVVHADVLRNSDNPNLLLAALEAQAANSDLTLVIFEPALQADNKLPLWTGAAPLELDAQGFPTDGESDTGAAYGHATDAVELPEGVTATPYVERNEAGLATEIGIQLHGSDPVVLANVAEALLGHATQAADAAQDSGQKKAMHEVAQAGVETELTRGGELLGENRLRWLAPVIAGVSLGDAAARVGATVVFAPRSELAAFRREAPEENQYHFVVLDAVEDPENTFRPDAGAYVGMAHVQRAVQEGSTDEADAANQRARELGLQLDETDEQGRNLTVWEVPAKQLPPATDRGPGREWRAAMGSA